MLKTTPLVAILILIPHAAALGTAQAPDRIVYEGNEESLLNAPLQPYLDSHSNVQLPPPTMIDTSLGRGYIATWQIKNNKLCVLKVEQPHPAAERDQPDEWRSVPLKTIFPKKSEPIVADWYTGTLRIPKGELVAYVHGGFGSRFETEILIRVEAGVVKKVGKLKNRKEPDQFRSLEDLRWVALGKPPQEPGDWIDARMLDGHVGKNVVTRGVFVPGEHHSALWIPFTSNSSSFAIRLDKIAEQKRPTVQCHVEVKGVLKKAKDSLILEVSSIRRLEFGESIHSDQFQEFYESQQHEKPNADAR